MRLALISIGLLLLSVQAASADVFAPADPPGGSSPSYDDRCNTRAGSVQLRDRVASKGPAFDVRDGQGPWMPLTGFLNCPTVTAGPDGTVALSGGDFQQRGRIVVRPPSGGFRAPVRVGPVTHVVVAAGRVVAWWLDGKVLRTVTIDRDGSVARAEIASGTVVPLELVIDATGTATLVWTAAGRLHVVRSPAGAGWSAGTEYPAGGLLSFKDPNTFDLAISPGGHTLMTWVAEDGLQAALDGEPAATVAAEAAAGSPRGAVNDAGEAVIAFGAVPGRVLALTRAAGGSWTAPQVISDTLQSDEGNEPSEEFADEPRRIDLDAVLGADGRAIVGWGTWSKELAATGRPAGGAWAPPVLLSSPVRLLEAWTAGFAADGSPQVSWDEFETDSRARKLARAAVWTPDPLAPPADRVAPIVDVRLPTRAPDTRTGQLRVRVPVRCSEACDVRLQVGLYGTVRTLVAGRTTTLTVASAKGDLAGHPGVRQFAVRLTVADRARNVVRRVGTLRLRVARRPLRSFEIKASYDLGTCTKAGNRELVRVVNSIIDGLADGSLKNARAIRGRWRSGVDAIERAHPDECLDDTDVRDRVYTVLDVPLTLAGYPDFYLDD